MHIYETQSQLVKAMYDNLTTRQIFNIILEVSNTNKNGLSDTFVNMASLIQGACGEDSYNEFETLLRKQMAKDCS